MIEYRALRREELPAWYKHCHSVFTLDDATYFERHFELDPDADCGLIFVAMDGSEIVSTVRVFRRTIWLNGRAVAMGGIGEVSTKPEYRRQGHCEALLRMAVEAMEARGMPVSILFGDQPVYERLGWRFCAARFTAVKAAALPTLSKDETARSFLPEDLPLLMGMYDLFAGRLNGAVIRAEAYWNNWVLKQWKPPVVLLSEGGPVAYACAAKGGDGKTLRVTELTAVPQAEARLPGFLRAIAEAEGCETVRVAATLIPALPGEKLETPRDFMARLNTPFDGLRDADALRGAFGQNAGMFETDMF